MKLWSVLSRLLTVFAVVGLVASAVNVPAIAGPMDAAATVAMVMADGMPPCDNDQKVPDCRGDMKTCPFANVCSAPVPSGLPAAASVVPPMVVALVIAPHDDWLRNGLAPLPPGRPPRP